MRHQWNCRDMVRVKYNPPHLRRRLTTFPTQASFRKRNHGQGPSCRIGEEDQGLNQEVVGKTAGNAKLEAEGKADKVEGKVQNAVGGLKDKATGQRKTSQRVSQSASPLSHTRLAKPSRSRRSSDGITETDLISDILPPAAAERRPRQRYGLGATMFRCFCYIRSAQAIQSRDKDDLSKSTSRPPPQSCPMGIFCNAISEGFG